MRFFLFIVCTISLIYNTEEENCKQVKYKKERPFQMFFLEIGDGFPLNVNRNLAGGNSKWNYNLSSMYECIHCTCWQGPRVACPQSVSMVTGKGCDLNCRTSIWVTKAAALIWFTVPMKCMKMLTVHSNSVIFLASSIPDILFLWHMPNNTDNKGQQSALAGRYCRGPLVLLLLTSYSHQWPVHGL